MQHGMSYLSKVVILCSALCIVGTFVHAGEHARPRAMVDVRSDGTHDFRGHAIQCDAERPIGIRIRDDRQASFVIDASTRFEGCDVALMIESSGYGPGLRRGRVEVAGVTIAAVATNTCIVDQGTGGLISENTLSGCKVGIFEDGNLNTIIGNTITHMVAEGVIVTGFGNLIEGNVITNNGREGINIMARVPQRGAVSPTKAMTAKTLNDRFLLAYTTGALANEIRGNYVHSNALADLRQWPDGCPGPIPPDCPECVDHGTNWWHDNDFATKYPDCLD